jgi:hypothetical protein
MAALILVLLLALILGGAGFAFRTCADAHGVMDFLYAHSARS